MGNLLQKPNRQKATFLFAAIMLCCFTLFGSPSHALAEKKPAGPGGDAVLKPISKSMDIQRKTQKREAGWTQEKTELLAILSELGARKKYLEKNLNKTQSLLALETEKNEAYLRKQQETDRIKEGLMSYLESVVKSLKAHIHSDMPFLMEERKARIASLDKMLVDPSESAAEQFRRVFEALQIETEYGSTVEVLQKEIDLEGGPVLVDVFRLGRISLFFLSIDGNRSGWFDCVDKKWRCFPKKMRDAMEKAVAMAKLERSVDFVKLPLGRIVKP